MREYALSGRAAKDEITPIRGANEYWEEIMKKFICGAVSTLAITAGGAHSDEISLRIGSGHPPGVYYVGQMINFFQVELQERVAERTDHTITFVEGYSGSIVKVNEVLEGVQDGVLDIGGYCFCFEPSNLPLHSFQAMVPFGPGDTVQSVAVARDVYEAVPYLTDVFPDEYNQVLISLVSSGEYHIGSNFAWGTLEDLQGERISGAGINLNWLEHAGVVPVTTSLSSAYTEMSTGLFDGFIIFPSAWLGLKLYEVADNYTLIGFGSVSWLAVTINQDTLNELPEDVRDILLEVAAEYEMQANEINQSDYSTQIERLREISNVTEISSEVRQQWAEALQPWVQRNATELEARGLPAIQVTNATLDAAEARDYDWPFRYVIE
jgi:TRAP-type C4-dicarboxylate transport system substrate-binding protein